MSWWVRLEADLGNGPVTLDLLGGGINYTSNVGGMFLKACGSTPMDWDGRKAFRIAEVCKTILKSFKSDYIGYKEMAPSNGWGDLCGAIAFIEAIQAACEKAPRATVRVSG